MASGFDGFGLPPTGAYPGDTNPRAAGYQDPDNPPKPVAGFPKSFDELMSPEKTSLV